MLAEILSLTAGADPDRIVRGVPADLLEALWRAVVYAATGTAPTPVREDPPITGARLPRLPWQSDKGGWRYV